MTGQDRDMRGSQGAQAVALAKEDPSPDMGTRVEDLMDAEPVARCCPVAMAVRAVWSRDVASGGGECWSG